MRDPRGWSTRWVVATVVAVAVASGGCARAPTASTAQTSAAGGSRGTVVHDAAGASGQSSGTPTVINGIGFWNAQDGLLAASQGCTLTVLATRDGGTVWNTVLRLPHAESGTPTVSGREDAWVPILPCNGKGTTKLVQTSDGGRVWKTVGDGSVANLDFVSATRGRGIHSAPSTHLTNWLGLTESLVNTDDGGRRWTSAAGPSCRRGDALGPLSAPDASTVYVMCAGQPGAGQQPKTLEVTTDGGKTWQVVASSGQSPAGISEAGYASGLDFVTPERGYLWMARGPLLVTEDGGRLWAGVDLGPQPDAAQPRSVSFVSTSVGFVLVQNEPQRAASLLATVDGGTKWNVVRTWQNSI